MDYSVELLSEKAEKGSYRYRRARALSYFVKDGEMVVYNFLTNRSFSCNLRCLELLIASEDWRPVGDLFFLTENDRTSSLIEEIVQLFSLTALVVEGDVIAIKDDEYHRTWEWGPVTAQMHFSSQDNPTVSDQIAAEIQILRSRDEPSPPLMHSGLDAGSIQLPRFELDNELNAVMRARRSIRAFLDEPVQLSVVSEALFAGLGITGIVSTEVGEHPLRMTPSPGARNAFEGYIFARNISGLEANRFFRYSGLHHRLEPVPPKTDVPTLEAMCADNQPWVKNAGVIILLVAHFERVMWKYLNGNAYGHVLIEAGHIAQNMMLVLNKHRLVANPVGAIAHSLIESALGENAIAHSVVYALAAGHPDTSHNEVAWLTSEFRMRDRLLAELGVTKVVDARDGG